MNSVWNKLYDPSKDRRNGFLFLIAFFAFFVVFALGMLAHGILSELDLGISDVQTVFLAALPGFLLLIVALAWRAIRQARPQQKKKFRRQELSRDEIAKARSKLVKFKN